MLPKHILKLATFLALLTLAGCEDNLNLPPLLLETNASWSSDGSTIAYYRNPVYASDTVGIWLVDSDGTNDRFFSEDMQADWSPDGERLVIATFGWNIYLIDKDGANFEWLIQDGESNSPAWSPDGKWVAFTKPYAGGGHRINLQTRETIQIPGVPGIDWAPDSRHVVHFWKAGNRSSEQAIKITDSQDSVSWVVRAFDIYDDGALYGIPRWSPDGEKILFEMDLGIWVVDTNGKCLRRLARNAVDPDWSPDGKHIVYTPYEDSARLWIMNANGWNKHPLREE